MAAEAIGAMRWSAGAMPAATSAPARTAEGVRRPAGPPVGDTPRVLGRAGPARPASGPPGLPSARSIPAASHDRATEPSAPTASPPINARPAALSGGAAGPARRLIGDLP